MMLIPDKKKNPYAFLQRPELLRHGCLGNKTFPGRPGKIQGFRYRHEILQLFQIHLACSLPSWLVISFTYCNMQSSNLQPAIFYPIIHLMNYKRKQVQKIEIIEKLL